MKVKVYRLTDSEIIKCIIFGKYRWYRKRKGGTWTFVGGCYPAYWINREPMESEISRNEVYRIERYE